MSEPRGRDARPRTFRVDHVGSLLRPPRLLEARAAHGAGRLDAAGLRAVEDDCIREAILRQQEAGFAVVTDGDFRRSAFHIDFLNALEGVRWDEMKFDHAFEGGPSQGESPAVFRTSAPIRHVAPITVDDWRFAQSCATAAVKVTMPSPSFAHYRGGRAAVDPGVYPDMDAFFADLAAAYRAEIAALAAAGCRYVQFDEVHFAFFCDPKMVAALRARGDDPHELAQVYTRLINDCIAERPADMAVGIHLCRGNRRSSWVAEGGYEPIAETLFNAIEADVFLLEYDSARAGGFEPLRFAPRGKRLVLGLVTSKSGELEPQDELVRRIEEAARFADIDDLAIGPQCGFASSTGGNRIDEAAQWRKLALCADVARRVWGRTD
ncbi:MAG: 5-methyltetrahydropteroyltriglutamate--homocysteine S-methyltransferase [Hyphomicrobiales bacterium]|nr:5-methyltetrahydropteroyltriglutamate--homocysteine S-methyltransferase [Hyphomicrobiales bacterium]